MFAAGGGSQRAGLSWWQVSLGLQRRGEERPTCHPVGRGLRGPWRGVGSSRGGAASQGRAGRGGAACGAGMSATSAPASQPARLSAGLL